MAVGFLAHAVRYSGPDSSHGNPREYLMGRHLRTHSAEHAATRIFTCHSWRASGDFPSHCEIPWQGDAVPGETELGSFGWLVEETLIGRIEAEFAKGEAVRVFTYDSEMELWSEDVLYPSRASRA